MNAGHESYRYHGNVGRYNQLILLMMDVDADGSFPSDQI